VLQPTKDKVNVQDLITGGKSEKLNVGASAVTTGQASPGDASINPKLKTKVLDQPIGSSTGGAGSGKQKFQTEVLHVDKEKLNIPDSSSSSTSSSSGQGKHHGRH
jgi:hypothetical protein